MKAIILAGGLGTRLRSIVGEHIPKCMAPINGRPFLSLIIDELDKQGIIDITLSVGYRAEVITQYYGSSINYKFEKEQLGTGGAIKNCITNEQPALVINGDTFAPMNYVGFMLKRTYPLSIASLEDGTSAGIYSTNPVIFNDMKENKFSFEKDIIPNTQHELFTIPWFIDIGTPEGYKKAQEIL